MADSSNRLRCVFVHGWGMNKAVWQPVVETLPGWIEPICIDLPGHGTSNKNSFSCLDDLVEVLNTITDDVALWVGWSLGGLVVMKLAMKYPEKVKAMMMVSTTPSFVERSDWQCGMQASVFDGFAAELEKDFATTIKRFLTLQVKGSDKGREILKTLRQKILAQPPANVESLAAGLSVLKNTDLRSQLDQLKMPVSWLLGEQDGLVDVSLANALNELLPAAEVNVLPKAAHAPFFSHLDEFNSQLLSLAKKVV